MTGESDVVKWRGVRQVDGVRGIWPERNAVRVYATGAADGNVISSIYTVPANKILLIASVFFASQYSGVDGSSSNLLVRDALEEEMYKIIVHLYLTTGSKSGGLPYSLALQAAAGWEVCVKNNRAESYSRGIMFGWLEDA